MTNAFRRLAAAIALAAGFASAPAGAAAISSTVTENGTTEAIKNHQPGTIGTFGFSDPVSISGGITGLVLTLTLTDGDTGAGDFDQGNLTLALDGFDTGLVLDGYTGSQTVTRSLSMDGLDGGLAQLIYSSLVSDGALVAEILDTDNDSASGARDHVNGKNFISFPSGYLAMLTLVGPAAPQARAIPEPGSLALAGVGLAGLTLSRRRKSA